MRSVQSLRWMLAISLMLNVAGLAFVASRKLWPPHARDGYREDKVSLYEELSVGRARIVLLGDSLTERGEWQELLGAPGIVNRGIGGETLRGATGRLGAVGALEPELVLVMLGINDLVGGRSPEDCAADYRALLGELREVAPRATVFAQSVLPVRPGASEGIVLSNDVVAELNRKIEAICAEGRCKYLDVGSSLADGGGNLDRRVSTDGLHLNGTGYRRWADTLGRALEEHRR